MSMRGPAVAFFICLATVLSLGSCSPGPTGAPKMGSPEWFWTAAKEQFAAGDFVKTQEHLHKVLESQSPLREKAANWHLVLTAGMARGYQDLAEAYDAGAMSSKTQALEFRRISSDMRRLSRQYTLALAEQLLESSKDLAAAEQFTLEFDWPIGSPNEPQTIGRVKKGILPPESERLTAHRQMLGRGIQMQAAAVVGAGEDTAKALEIFKTQPVQVSKSVFLCGLGESLIDQSALFDRRKLNEPDKKRVLLQLASDSIKAAAGGADEAVNKKAKELETRIEKEQKALPKA